MDFQHVHPEVKKALKGFHDKFQGRVSIQRVLGEAGASLDQLLSWEKFEDDMCWNWAIGSCKWGKECKYSASHVDGKAMPKEVAGRLLEVIKPGVEKMMREDYSDQTAAKRPGMGRGGGWDREQKRPRY